MSFLSSIKNFFGLDNSEEEKKRKQQQQSNATTQSKAPSRTVVPNTVQTPQTQVNQAPDNGVNLQLLQKTPTSPTGSPTLLKKGPMVMSPQPAAAPDKRNILKRAYDTVNVIDNGRSWNTETPTADNTKNAAEQVGDVGRFLVKNTAKTVNTGAEGVRQTGELTLALNARATGNKEAEKAAIARSTDKSQSLLENGRGILGVGGVITADEAKNGLSPTEFTKRVAGTGLGVAGEVLPGTQPAKGASIAAKTVRGAAEGAGIAVVGDTGEQILDDKPGIDIKQTAAAAAFGGVLGGGSANIPRKAPVDEANPGMQSVNPDQAKHAIEQAVDNTPAYASQNPATVGQAVSQQSLTGNTKIPDQVFDADARVAGADVPDPLDVPAFMRKNAGEKASSAKETAAMLDQRAEQIRAQMSEAAKFKDKQEIAAAFAESPAKGQAVARAIKARNARLDPQTELTKTIAARAQATKELRQAEEAQAAQQALEAPTAKPAEVAPVPAPVVNAPAAPVDMVPPVVNETPIVPNDTLVPPVAPVETPVAQALVDTNPVSPLNTAPNDVSLPQIPELPGAEQAAAAPRTHDALVKSMGDVGKEFKGKYATRDVIQLDELKQKAQATIANVPDEDLVRSFATADVDTMITDPKSFAVARAALDRLYAMPDDPLAFQQVSNILDAMSKFESRAGQNLRVIQEEFDNMPLPMKVRYIVKRIDKANAETKDYAALADDPAKATVVEATITGHLKASQDIAERVSALQGQLDEIAANPSASTKGKAAELAAQVKAESRSLEANNGELVKYYTSLVPGRTAGQKVNDFARRAMLASFTGRVNDIVTTAANVGNLSATNLTQGVIAKGVNAIKGPGTVTDTLRGGGKLVKGIKSGAEKTVGEVRGTQYTEDLQKSLAGNTETRSQLQKSTGKISRTVQAATEAATNLSEGVRDQRVYQLAIQEGQKAGFTGADLATYAEARSAVPTRQMLEQADQLHKEMNNLNDNPVSRTLNRIAAGIEGKSAVGGFLKNQVMPFTSWLGGNIYNSITDKNVVASTYKFARDVKRGDVEGAVRNLAKGINGAAQAYALGYLLTQKGYITNENAEGYNDAGGYFHIGDRYIPLGVVGFVVPNIILGNAAYNGMHNEDGENPAIAIAKELGENTIKALSLGNAMGVESNLARAYQETQKVGGDFVDGAATLTAGAVGQFIPALQGDINAVLNNGLNIGGKQIISDSLNPTHEKADTKVVQDKLTKSGDPSTARDVPKSVVEGIKNRVPFLSQTLPRKPGTAAPDLVDRTTRGDRDTGTSKDTRTEAKKATDQAKDFEKRDIPNPNEDGFDKAVEARFEEKQYDKAIEGLQAKLNKQKANKDVPKSDIKDIEDKIKLYQVHKAGSYEPDLIEKYKSTSLTDWRNMGDPESDDYDPETYQKLFEYDTARANATISKDTDKPGKNFYTAKEAKKKGSGSGSGDSTVKSNTVGSTPSLGKFSFGDLTPQKAGTVKAAKIAPIRASELKKRKISVSKG